MVLDTFMAVFFATIVTGNYKLSFGDWEAIMTWTHFYQFLWKIQLLISSSLRKWYLKIS